MAHRSGARDGGRARVSDLPKPLARRELPLAAREPMTSSREMLGESDPISKISTIPWEVAYPPLSSESR
jgi:hypothetical protein